MAASKEAGARIRVLATSIAQIVVGRKTRRERAGAGGREAVNGRKRPVHGPSSSSPEASAPGGQDPDAGLIEDQE